MKIKKLIVLTSLALAAGCSTTADVPSVAEMLRDATPQNGRTCIRSSDIQSYGILENNLLSINGIHNYYLATVLPGCTDLRGSLGLIFDGSHRQVCGQRADRLVSQSSQCAIGQIYRFENRREAFDVYQAVVEQREELKRQAQAQ